MKPPVKDKVTMPWISDKEIPAIKLILSKWRKLRRSKAWKEEQKAESGEDADELSETAAKCCERLMRLDEMASQK